MRSPTHQHSPQFVICFKNKNRGLVFFESIITLHSFNYLFSSIKNWKFFVFLGASFESIYYVACCKRIEFSYDYEDHFFPMLKAFHESFLMHQSTFATQHLPRKHSQSISQVFLIKLLIFSFNCSEETWTKPHHSFIILVPKVRSMILGAAFDEFCAFFFSLVFIRNGIAEVLELIAETKPLRFFLMRPTIPETTFKG